MYEFTNFELHICLKYTYIFLIFLMYIDINFILEKGNNMAKVFKRTAIVTLIVLFCAFASMAKIQEDRDKTIKEASISTTADVGGGNSGAGVSFELGEDTTTGAFSTEPKVESLDSDEGDNSEDGGSGKGKNGNNAGDGLGEGVGKGNDNGENTEDSTKPEGNTKSTESTEPPTDEVSSTATKQDPPDFNLTDLVGYISCNSAKLNRVPISYGDDQWIINSYDICMGTYNGRLFGEGKPTLLAGHNTKSLANLKYAEVGDTIRIDTVWGETYTYEIYYSAITNNVNNEYLTDLTTNENLLELYNDSNNLQIYTCCDWGLAYRYFVKARLI